MINYTDYEFYSTVYMGQLTDGSFSKLLPKANILIANAMNRQIEKEEINEQIQLVACQLIDVISSQDYTSKDVASESVDGVSISYSNSGNSQSAYSQILNTLPLELITFI